MYSGHDVIAQLRLVEFFRSYSGQAYLGLHLGRTLVYVQNFERHTFCGCVVVSSNHWDWLNAYNRQPR